MISEPSAGKKRTEAPPTLHPHSWKWMSFSMYVLALLIIFVAVLLGVWRDKMDPERAQTEMWLIVAAGALILSPKVAALVSKVKFGDMEFSLNQIESRQEQLERELQKTKRELQEAEQFIQQLTEDNARLAGSLQTRSARREEGGSLP